MWDKEENINMNEIILGAIGPSPPTLVKPLYNTLTSATQVKRNKMALRKNAPPILAFWQSLCKSQANPPVTRRNTEYPSIHHSKVHSGPGSFFIVPLLNVNRKSWSPCIWGKSKAWPRENRIHKTTFSSNSGFREIWEELIILK